MYIFAQEYWQGRYFCISGCILWDWDPERHSISHSLPHTSKRLIYIGWGLSSLGMLQITGPGWYSVINQSSIWICRMDTYVYGDQLDNRPIQSTQSQGAQMEGMALCFGVHCSGDIQEMWYVIGGIQPTISVCICVSMCSNSSGQINLYNFYELFSNMHEILNYDQYMYCSHLFLRISYELYHVCGYFYLW